MGQRSSIKVLFLRILGAFGVLAITAGVFYTNILPSPVRAAVNDHRLIVGMLSSCADRGAWHDDEIDQVSALDLDRDPPCSGTTAGTPVYYRGYGVSGSRSIQAYTTPHNGECPGVDVELWDGSLKLGEEHYVQINLRSGVLYQWFTAGQGWTNYSLGWVAGSRPCSLWTGPHLHQSGTNAADTKIYTNWGIEDPIDPTTDQWNNWMHKVYW